MVWWYQHSFLCIESFCMCCCVGLNLSPQVDAACAAVAWCLPISQCTIDSWNAFRVCVTLTSPIPPPLSSVLIGLLSGREIEEKSACFSPLTPAMKSFLWAKWTAAKGRTPSILWKAPTDLQLASLTYTYLTKLCSYSCDHNWPALVRRSGGRRVKKVVRWTIFWIAIVLQLANMTNDVVTVLRTWIKNLTKGSGKLARASHSPLPLPPSHMLLMI